jgi:hypothetical protein
VVAAFKAKLPSFLDHFVPLTGRLVVNPNSGSPELHCDNQGAELVVGEVGVALASMDYSDLWASLARIGIPVRYAPAIGAAGVVRLRWVRCGMGQQPRAR